MTKYPLETKLDKDIQPGGKPNMSLSSQTELPQDTPVRVERELERAGLDLVCSPSSVGDNFMLLVPWLCFSIGPALVCHGAWIQSKSTVQPELGQTWS